MRDLLEGETVEVRPLGQSNGTAEVSPRYAGLLERAIASIVDGIIIIIIAATIRFIMKSAIPALLRTVINNCLGLIYGLANVLIMYTNEKRQCFHDMAAGTVVVHNEK